MQHGLKALAATLSEGELTKQNVSIAIVGAGAPFVLLDDDDVEPYVSVGVALRLGSGWAQYAVVLKGLGVPGRGCCRAIGLAECTNCVDVREGVGVARVGLVLGGLLCLSK